MGHVRLKKHPTHVWMLPEACLDDAQTMSKLGPNLVQTWSELGLNLVLTWSKLGLIAV